MRNRFFRTTLVLTFLLAVIYVAGAFYFKDHSYPMTTYGSTPIGNLTTEGIKAKLDTLDEKKFVIKEGDKKAEIDGKDIKFDVTYNASDIKLQDNYWSWPIEVLKKHEWPILSYKATYDADLLKEKVNSLSLLKEVERHPSVDAYIRDGEDRYVIVDDVLGNEVDMEKYFQAVMDGVNADKTEIDVAAASPYIPAAVTKDNEELNNKLAKLNEWVGTDIKLNVEGEIKPLVDWKNQYGLKTSDDPDFEEYNRDIYIKIADEFAEKYNTVNAKRIFRNSMGETIYVDAGTFGWKLAYDRFLERLSEGVARGKVAEIAVPFDGVANGEPPNDIGNTYIEIDLSTQHLWIYKDGQEVIDTPIVSGDVNVAGSETPTGVYFLLYKKENETLKGQGYSQPVKFWMPFTNEGHGLHDADWRGDFGGDTYLYGGSHGCINLPPDLAEKIYNTVETNMAVVIYKSEFAESAPANSDANGNPAPSFNEVQPETQQEVPAETDGAPAEETEQN